MVNTVAALYRAGQPLPFPMYDAHMHTGRWYHFPILDGESDGMLRAMDSAGIRAAILTSLAALGPDPRAGNDDVRYRVRAHPGRFLGYVTTNAHYPQAMRAELERCLGAPEFVGVKVHQSVCGAPADSPAWDPVYEAADARGWLVLSHTWGATEVNRHADTLKRFHRLQLLLGHAGADYEGYRAAVALAREYDNVFLDLTLSLTRRGIVEWLVREIGPERIVFGTDMPFLDGRGAPGWIIFADIDDAAKALILGGNLRRVLGDAGRVWDS